MKNKTKNKKSTFIVIQSLDQLQELVDPAVMVRFSIDNQNIELPVKRLTPQMKERCRAIERAAQPPWNPTRKDYDPLDTKFLEARDLAQNTARALKVYSCCEAISKAKPGLTDPKDIHAFVQSKLTDNILDLITLAADAGGLSVAQEVQSRANFSSTPDSES